MKTRGVQQEQTEKTEGLPFFFWGVFNTLASFGLRVGAKRRGLEFFDSALQCSGRAVNLRAGLTIPFPLLPSVPSLLCLLLLSSCVQVGSGAWVDLWFTPDQQGRRHFERGESAEAAAVFRDPLWQGVAWYRAGEFEKAARAFARRDTAEAHYNQGNAWLMHGKYQAAIDSYTKALEKRPDWREAAENRAIAEARAKALDIEGGNMTEGMLEADKIVFDAKKGSDAQTDETTGGKALSDAEIQALWLRRVQTRPADFLKAKFAYQLAMRPEGAK
jgi:Ca-activated chloride channel family protein